MITHVLFDPFVPRLLLGLRTLAATVAARRTQESCGRRIIPSRLQSFFVPLATPCSDGSTASTEFGRSLYWRIPRPSSSGHGDNISIALKTLEMID